MVSYSIIYCLISGLFNCIHYFCVDSIVYEDADDYERMPFLEILQDEFKNGSLQQFLIIIFICFYENVLYHDINYNTIKY